MRPRSTEEICKYVKSEVARIAAEYGFIGTATYYVDKGISIKFTVSSDDVPCCIIILNKGKYEKLDYDRVTRIIERAVKKFNDKKDDIRIMYITGA